MSRLAPSKECAVLVPTYRGLEPECEDALRLLASEGYQVRVLRGSSFIDLARSTLATRAFDEGFRETLWIDSDMSFTLGDVERLRAHDLPICAALYVKKGEAALACKFKTYGHITLGKGGGLLEVQYVGMGMTHIRNQVYASIAKGMPRCYGGYGGEEVYPFFLPALIPCKGANPKVGFTFLSEDYSFCHRAIACGYTIMADTTIMVGHHGMYKYTWVDMMGKPEIETINIDLEPPKDTLPDNSNGLPGPNKSVSKSRPFVIH